MTDTPLHIAEFGNSFKIESEIVDALSAAGFHDDSWHNDICPSFVHGGRPDGLIVKIWIDAKEVSDREMDEDSDTRFLVSLGEDGDCCSELAFYTDDFSEALTKALDALNTGAKS